MHISFIMDGNGRWAKSRGLPRSAGHKAGADTLKRIVSELGKIGVEEATFYAFSTENWNRPASEVKFLMKLLEEFLKTQIRELHRMGGVFRMIGSYDALPEKTIRLMKEAEDMTAKNTGIRMNIAFNYGGRAEILNAVKEIAAMVRRGDLEENQIDEALFSSKLYLKRDPDLLIRTGGEQRLSNYLLWQHSYTEFVFLDTLWPDFNETLLRECIRAYESRDRRFGNITPSDA